jgi:hypothetical protein
LTLENIQEIVPRKYGWEFKGWNIGSAPLTLPLNIKANQTISAVFERVEFSLTFRIEQNPVSGNLVTPNPELNDRLQLSGLPFSGTELSRPFEMLLTSINMPLSVREGHTFAGWYTESQVSGLQSPENLFMPSNPPSDWEFSFDRNVTLFPRFDIITYTITFDPIGGTPAPPSVDRTYWTALTSPVLEKEGFDFDGWYSYSLELFMRDGDLNPDTAHLPTLYLTERLTPSFLSCRNQ